MSKPTPQPARRRNYHAALLVSLAFHIVVVGPLAWFAAREGMLGQQMRQITVWLVPPPPPSQPTAPEKSAAESPPAKPNPLPQLAPPTASAPTPANAPAPLHPSASAPPVTLPPVAAPPPAELPSLVFDDGANAVQTESDPAALYRSFVEFNLRSRWNRPMDTDDANYVAEIVISVDPVGRIGDPHWRRKSGDTRWDASVIDAVKHTPRLDRPPPVGFPAQATVRFDVVHSPESSLE